MVLAPARRRRLRWIGGAAAGVPGVERVRLSRRSELVTMLCGTWLMIGLFVDGWAHSNLTALETFFTPWHALFYSGFTATAAWVAWQAFRCGAHRRGLDALPLGYRGAAAGVAVFGIGGLGDMTWHVVFGVEQDIDALFSPTHLLLFVGIALILSAPLRAAWAAEVPGGAPTFRDFLPVVMSVTLTTTLFAFMLLYLAAFSTNGAGEPVVAWASGLDPDGAAAHWLQVTTLAAIFTTNAALVAPLLLVARRWQPPMGTATMLFTTIAVLTGALHEFALPLFVVAAAVAGLLTDLLLRAMRPSPDRPRAFWAVGALVPLLVWPLWFLALALQGGIGWSLEVWTGSILWTAILGGTLALVMLPPVGATVPGADRDEAGHLAEAAPPPGTAGAPLPQESARPRIPRQQGR